jgi:hypothetical protein
MLSNYYLMNSNEWMFEYFISERSEKRDKERQMFRKSNVI